MKIYETKEIEICEVDYKGRYRLPHLFNRFAQVATKSAIELGMWNQDLEDKYGWIVAKQTLKLKQPIMLNDVISIGTEIGKSTFVTFPRYYSVYKDNQEIAHCSSLWTLLDIKLRRIVSPKKIGMEIPKVNTMPQFPPKTINTDIPLDYKCTRQVLYSDVDTNQHMNNTRYIEWALDVLDYDIYQNSYVKEISINYKKEILPLEFVELYANHVDNTYIIQGKNHGEEAFIIELILEEK